MMNGDVNPDHTRALVLMPLRPHKSKSAIRKGGGKYRKLQRIFRELNEGY